MKNMKSKIVSLVLAVSLLTGIFSCTVAIAEDATPDFSNETFVVGYFGNLPDTGDCRIQRNVIKLFVDKWNNEKTFFGATVKYVEYDNANNGDQDTEMSIKDANKLISQDHANVIIPAQLSNIIQATGTLINDYEVLDIGLGLSTTWMNQGWDYVYRTALNNDFAIPSVAATIKNNNQNNVAFLYENTDNCLTYRTSFMKNAEELGLNIVIDEMISSEGGSGNNGQIAKTIAANPDCVFISGMGDHYPAFINLLRSQGYKGIIYIPQSLMATEAQAIQQEYLNGVSAFSMYLAYDNIEDCNDPFVKDVLQQYYDAYGEVAKSDMTYKIWDAMLLIENAVLEAKSLDPKAIQPAIKNLKFDGCGGVMDFTTGSNECYFDTRAWVYTGSNSAGGAMLFEDWLNSDYAKEINITAE